MFDIKELLVRKRKVSYIFLGFTLDLQVIFRVINSSTQMKKLRKMIVREGLEICQENVYVGVF